MDLTLKKEINDCYMYGEIISQQGLGPANDITMSEMIKFDLLQFLAYLIEDDCSNLTDEIAFIQQYLGQYFTADKLKIFKYERTVNDKFSNTVPRSFTYFAGADLSGKSAYTLKGFSKSRNLYNVYNQLGQQFIACNSVTSDNELSKFTEYVQMIEEYLRKHKIFESGKGPIAAGKVDNPYAKTPSSSNSSINAMKGQLNSDELSENELNLESLMNELNALTGLEDVKKDIKSLINLLKVKKLREERGMKQPAVTLHMVFSGNPGTGKTTVARLLAKIYKCIGVLPKGQLVEVDRSNLVEGFVGQTAIKTKEVIESALGGVLFIDEAYTLTAGKDNKDFGQEAVDTLLKMMEDNRDNLVVIVAGYTDLMEEFVSSNPGLKSRFNKYINFKDYNADELFDIFVSMCKNQEYEADAEGLECAKAYLKKKADNRDENFANAREVRNYIERAISRQASRVVEIENISDDELKTLTKADLAE